jgi:hypothetical protein
MYKKIATILNRKVVYQKNASSPNFFFFFLFFFFFCSSGEGTREVIGWGNNRSTVPGQRSGIDICNIQRALQIDKEKANTSAENLNKLLTE